MIERVVFDTSTLVGAALKVGSKSHQALMFALEHCVLCGSKQLLQELTEVLSRSYFVRSLPQPERDTFLVIVEKNLETFWVSKEAARSLNPPCRDGNDNFILALALASQAEAIVSSDHHLLALNPWNGIPILTPAQFVAQFPTGEASQ